MKNKKFIYFIIFLLVIIIIIADMRKESTVKQKDPAWMSNYQMSRKESDIPDEYIQETNYFDTSSLEVQAVTNNILKNAYSTEDAVQRALDYVYFNIEYNPDESDATCFEATGSKVILAGSGQCDSQTVALVSILRAMSIAARPVGGCYAISTLCDLKYSIFSAIGKPLRMPKSKPIKITEGAEWVGRAGFLHAYAEVFLPDQGWVIAESTAGRLMKGTCLNYYVEVYPTTLKEICVSTNITYAIACAYNDFKKLGAQV